MSKFELKEVTLGATIVRFEERCDDEKGLANSDQHQTTLVLAVKGYEENSESGNRGGTPTGTVEIRLNTSGVFDFWMGCPVTIKITAPDSIGAKKAVSATPASDLTKGYSTIP